MSGTVMMMMMVMVMMMMVIEPSVDRMIDRVVDNGIDDDNDERRMDLGDLVSSSLTPQRARAPFPSFARGACWSVHLSACARGALRRSGQD